MNKWATNLLLQFPNVKRVARRRGMIMDCRIQLAGLTAAISNERPLSTNVRLSLSHPVGLGRSVALAQQQGDLVALNEIRLGRLSPTNYQRNQSLILAQAPDEIALDECDRRRFVVAVHFN